MASKKRIGIVKDVVEEDNFYEEDLLNITDGIEDEEESVTDLEVKDLSDKDEKAESSGEDEPEEEEVGDDFEITDENKSDESEAEEEIPEETYEEISEDEGGGDGGGDDLEREKRTSSKRKKPTSNYYKFPKNIIKTNLKPRDPRCWESWKRIIKKTREFVPENKQNIFDTFCKEQKSDGDIVTLAYNLLYTDSPDTIYREEEIKDGIELRNITEPIEPEEGVYKCECGSNRTFSFSLQLRSADEPMTSFITCAECGKKWREN